MLEKQIENKLTKSVKKADGIALKFVPPSFAGMPDYLIGCLLLWSLRLQKKHHANFRYQGTKCYVHLVLKFM